MNIKRIIHGLATYVPGVGRQSYESTQGAVRSRYCYSVWMRHLALARRNGLTCLPNVVAEMGPGDSLGVGLAAMLCGADRYYALDVVPYARNSTNLRVFDELVELLRRRQDIPGPEEFPRVCPRLESYAFAQTALDDAGLTAAMADDRLAAIRRAIMTEPDQDGPIQIRYFAPWYDLSAIVPESVGLILSQAVLEYVPDLEQTYRAFHRWLAPGGMLSLVIDYTSHGTADRWDGHWAYGDFTWRLMRGNRPYYLNRCPHSTHMRCLEEAGLKVVSQDKLHTDRQTPDRGLARRFRAMSDDDRTTCGAFIQAVKPPL